MEIPKPRACPQTLECTAGTGEDEAAWRWSSNMKTQVSGQGWVGRRVRVKMETRLGQAKALPETQGEAGPACLLI